MIDVSQDLHEVITFYSYKGGTGRSMALANVACLLGQAHQGKKFSRSIGTSKLQVSITTY